MGEWGYAGSRSTASISMASRPATIRRTSTPGPKSRSRSYRTFLKAIYQQAIAINPDAVVEICPCGTSHAFHDMPYMNQAVASDPLSSWQVRHKGKTIKALMGPSAAYAGDHVELSDHADDFASTIGVGGIVSTKFTWPRDRKPKNGLLLTPQKEAQWRRWIALYNDKRLPQGRYRGDLYDIGFDKPKPMPSPWMTVAFITRSSPIAGMGLSSCAGSGQAPIRLRIIGPARPSARHRQRQIASPSNSGVSSCSRRRCFLPHDGRGRRGIGGAAKGVARLCVCNHHPVGIVGRVYRRLRAAWFS